MSRRAFSLFSALFSTSTASSSNPSPRQLKEIAVKDLVNVRISPRRKITVPLNASGVHSKLSPKIEL
jgi:hypothetical protein